MAELIKQQIALKPFNTFGIQALARYFAKATDQTSLEQIIRENKQLKQPILVLGGGSNLLLTQDYEGLVIKMENKGIHLERETADEVFIRVGAGEDWHALTQTCVANGWGGLENLSLIPGSVGAAPIQNIGAYGVELKEHFVSLRAYDLYTDVVREFDKHTCGFGYRHSVFKTPAWKSRAVILDVTFRLSRQPQIRTEYGAIRDTLAAWGIAAPTISDVSRAVIHIRQSKLPDPAATGNCGSFFKNPVISSEQFEQLKSRYPQIVGYEQPKAQVKVPAGWLIEQAGWKGKQVGNVGMHHKQALVMVNRTGQATGEEAWGFAQQVQADVRKKFGIELQPEVNII